MHIDPKQTVNKLSREIGKSKKSALFNLNWLLKHMHPYFFITFSPEKDALLNLCMDLHTLGENHQLVLRNTDEKLIMAILNKPGTLFKTLDSIKDKVIIYAEMIHSNAYLPGQESELEIQKFHFLTDKEKRDSTSFFEARDLSVKILRITTPILTLENLIRFSSAS